MIQKEIKSDVRAMGFQALTEWIILYKTRPQNDRLTTGRGDADGTVSKSYETILQEFIRVPIQPPPQGTAPQAYCTQPQAQGNSVAVESKRNARKFSVELGGIDRSAAKMGIILQRMVTNFAESRSSAVLLFPD